MLPLSQAFAFCNKLTTGNPKTIKHFSFLCCSSHYLRQIRPKPSSQPIQAFDQAREHSLKRESITVELVTICTGLDSIIQITTNLLIWQHQNNKNRMTICTMILPLLHPLLSLFDNFINYKYIRNGSDLLCESPGLVVMGLDSSSKGHEFKYRHHILDGHFFTYLFVVNL